MIITDKQKPVLVTGATGYVAGRVVEKLLHEGFTVHATVRKLTDTQKLEPLNKVAANAPGKLVFFEADLLKPDSFTAAMQDCQVVFHTASPFTLSVKNAQSDLVDPAVNGTRNVLNSVNQTNTVKRVVLTSSCAAIYGDNIDLQNTPGKVFTEDIWNTSSSLTHQPYSYSKVLAEKEAWKIDNAQSRWDLVVVNPSLVIGPGISATGTSESYNLVKQLTDGTMKSGVPDLSIGVVDVRDLAIAHYNAAFTPEAKGRYIVSAANSSLLELALMLREKYGNTFPIPKKKLPKFLLILIGPLFGFKRKMLKQNLGFPFIADNSKGIKELGISYRPVKDSIIEFVEQLKKG